MDYTKEDGESCEIKWCKSKMPATDTTTEIIGDGAFSVSVCSQCKALFGSTLPNANEVEKKLKGLSPEPQ